MIDPLDAGGVGNENIAFTEADTLDMSVAYDYHIREALGGAALGLVEDTETNLRRAEAYVNGHALASAKFYLDQASARQQNGWFWLAFQDAETSMAHLSEVEDQTERADLQARIDNLLIELKGTLEELKNDWVIGPRPSETLNPNVINEHRLDEWAAGSG